MPLKRRKKRHAILHSIHIPATRFRPLRWLILLSVLLFLAQLGIEFLLHT